MPENLTTWLAIYAAVLSSLVFLRDAVKFISERHRKLKVTFFPSLFIPENPTSDVGGTFTVIITNVARTPIYVQEPGFLYRHRGSWKRELFYLSDQTERPIVYVDFEAALEAHSRKVKKAAPQEVTFPVRLEYSQSVTVSYKVSPSLVRREVLERSITFWAITRDGLGRRYISNKYRIAI